MKQIPYEYKNAPIPGGGYVTGFLFDKKRRDVLFCRTDIGGTYRYDAKLDCWKSLIDHVTMEKSDETCPIAIALDEETEGKFYTACGVGRGNGTLVVSADYGNSFLYKEIPTPVHGNWGGRGSGYRLACKDKMLYFASQVGGLFITEDEGESWRQTDVGGEKFLTFVWASPKRPGMLIVGTAGAAVGKKEEFRGPALYVSYDGGDTFEIMTQPENTKQQDSLWPGYVAERYDYDGRYFYVTMAQTAMRAFMPELSYSCDCGDVQGGMVLRYSFDEEGKIAGYEDITPYHTIYRGGNAVQETKGTALAYGFGGISSTENAPGLLVCTTLCKQDGDIVYRSFDYGTTWECILYDLRVGKLEFRTSYMKPEYNGGKSLLHWLSDIKIDTHDKNTAWFNSGTGVFRTKNLTAETVVFSDWCDGIEETVHLNVYSPNAGPVQVIDIVGDLGGFAFRDLTKPCKNSFDDENGNRYITCLNADYSELTPECFIATARGNWTGKTKGGLIMTKDAGETFERLSMPFGLSDRRDELLHRIERPNTNSGWVAMSPNCENIVWTIGDRFMLTADAAVVSNDGGKTFAACTILDKSGNPVKDARGFKVFSDRVKNRVFYAFGEASQIYISRDGGNTFCEKALPEGFPEVKFHHMDGANKTEVRGDAGRSGIFYMALKEHGLWKMVYNAETDDLKAKRLTKDKETVHAVGLGVLTSGGVYLGENKAVYIAGTIAGEYGFYRSFDDAKTWERINDKSQMFGNIMSIDGDSRTFGRFFLATGTRGLIYGEPTEEK